MSNPSGALLGTRVAVLAAEVADPERYRRGRAYARAGAVEEVDVTDGVLNGTVLGSRPEPYAVSITVSGRARRGPLPGRGDIRARCTCPDDVPTCKHAVAVLLSFAEMVTRDPELLAQWTGEAQEWDDPEPPDDDDDDDDEPRELVEFFGTRDSRLSALVVLAPLESPPRPEGDGLETTALDALDHARRALRALFG